MHMYVGSIENKEPFFHTQLNPYSRFDVPGVQVAVHTTDNHERVIDRNGAERELLVWVAQQHALLNVLHVPHHDLQTHTHRRECERLCLMTYDVCKPAGKDSSDQAGG